MKHEPVLWLRNVLYYRPLNYFENKLKNRRKYHLKTFFFTFKIWFTSCLVLISSFNESIALTITHHPKISLLGPFKRSISTVLCFALLKKHCFDKKKRWHQKSSNKKPFIWSSFRVSKRDPNTLNKWPFFVRVNPPDRVTNRALISPLANIF